MIDLPDAKKMIIQVKMNQGKSMSQARAEAERDYPDLFATVEKKKSKYGNKKVSVDGIPFDSQKEANYYCDLKLRKRAGDIDWFLCQVPILCNEGDDTGKPIRYFVDFVVCEKGGTIRFDDVKPSKTFLTDVYKIKKKLVRSQHGIEIQEVY